MPDLGASQGKSNLVVPHIEFGAIWVAAANMGQKLCDRKGRLETTHCLSSLQIISRQNLSFLAPAIYPKHITGRHCWGQLGGEDRQPTDSIISGRILVTFTVSDLSPSNKQISVR